MKVIRTYDGTVTASHQFKCEKCNAILEIQYRDLETFYADKDERGMHNTLKHRCKCPVCWQYNIFDKIPRHLYDRRYTE